LIDGVNAQQAPGNVHPLQLIFKQIPSDRRNFGFFQDVVHEIARVRISDRGAVDDQLASLVEGYVRVVFNEIQ
jgi:hypothetical protein